MAIIPHPNLFSWEQIESSPEIQRLRMVLDGLPDEELMTLLEQKRGNGRDDYPIRPIWNSLIAGIVYQHPSISSLIRELLRNGELRQTCGFDPTKGEHAVPKAYVYTRFLSLLFKRGKEIDEMFDRLIEELRKVLPDLGENLAVDSKAIWSYGRPTKKTAKDGRRDTDANWGTKTYRGVREDGTLWEKTMHWFGYKLHLMVDSRHELPLGFNMTKASASDTVELLPLIEEVKRRHPELIDNAQHLSADRGYDSEENNRVLYDKYRIKPLIDIRDDWHDGEKTRALDAAVTDGVVTDFRGNISCVSRCLDDPRKMRKLDMVFVGFEKERMALKYRCPAELYGLRCSEEGTACFGRHERVKMEKNRRRFVPVPRDTCKWNRLYAERSAVERVNSRLDRLHGFEEHYIRGIKKMTLRVGLALIVMLAMALGAIKMNRRDLMRSLVWHPRPIAATSRLAA